MINFNLQAFASYWYILYLYFWYYFAGTVAFLTFCALIRFGELYRREIVLKEIALGLRKTKRRIEIAPRPRDERQQQSSSKSDERAPNFDDILTE